MSLTQQTSAKTKSARTAKFSSLYCAISLALMPASAMISMPVYAEVSQPATLQQFNISAGPMAKALRSFASQAGISISFQDSLVQGLQNDALIGKYDIERGFNHLIGDASLNLRATGKNAYVIEKRDINVLATAQVTASQESATSRFEGYVAQQSSTGSRADTPIMELPQSITVVGAQEINVRKSQSLEEVLSYTAGISVNGGPDKTGDSLMVRGFESYSGVNTMYQNGKRYLVNVYDGVLEPYGQERIEVLKGAASLLYGASAPGGIINSVSKRPTLESINEIGIDVGNFNRKQLTADFAGAVTDAEDVSYRLTLLARDSDSFIDHIPDNKIYIAPALSWQISEFTNLTLLSHYQKNESAYVSSKPEEGTIFTNPNGPIPKENYTGEPDKDQAITENISLSYIFDHQFTDKLSLNHSLNYFTNKGSFDYTWLGGFIDDNKRKVDRGFQERDEKSTGFATDAHLIYNFSFGNIEQTLTAGIDMSQYEFDTKRYNRNYHNGGILDIYSPVYGAEFGERTENPWSSLTKTERLGFYLQDQIKIDQQWIIALGLRQEQVKEQPQSHFPVSVAPEETSNALTGNIGMVYLADNGLAPFVSYSQSFEPQSGQDRELNRFKPSEGEQVEAGIRYQPTTENYSLSATMYHLSNSNVLTTDPIDDNYEVQTGEVTSKGFEFEAKGKLTDNLQFIAAYAYTDTRTTKSNNPDEVDQRRGGVPFNQLSLWTDYQLSTFKIPELTLGAGMRYVDETKAMWMDNVKISNFTLFDAMVSYETNNWRYALNVRNLADKNYLSSCTFTCFYGEGRKIIASVNYSF